MVLGAARELTGGVDRRLDVIWISLAKAEGVSLLNKINKMKWILCVVAFWHGYSLLLVIAQCFTLKPGLEKTLVFEKRF